MKQGDVNVYLATRGLEFAHWISTQRAEGRARCKPVVDASPVVHVAAPWEDPHLLAADELLQAYCATVDMFEHHGNLLRCRAGAGIDATSTGTDDQEYDQNDVVPTQQGECGEIHERERERESTVCLPRCSYYM